MQTSISNSLTAIRAVMEKAVSPSLLPRITLVGVTKTRTPELIKEAYENGIRNFGENYVQEFLEKQHLLPSDIKWHFIGNLQSNKVKQVLLPNLYMIETIDSLK